VTRRVVVLASGNGSNLQALLDAAADGRLGGRVVAVVSDRSDAHALERARAAGTPALALARHDGESRGTYDARLAEVVAPFEPDFVVLAGWMRILTMAFLGRFAGRVVNLHPALPGEYPGTHAVERAFADHLERGLDRTGVMVHLVPDEGVDDGPVLATETVRIEPGDDLDTLTERIHETEHRLLVTTLARLCTQEVRA